MEIKIEKNVIQNEKLRNGFFELSKSVFGLDFEPWYNNGFCTERYLPYTIFDGDKAVANVSVNRCDFMCQGALRHYLQLGTVMTDPAYRKQGLICRIMEEIDKDYQGKIDGIFLFANDEVLDFYPKFGFVKSEEHCFVKKVELDGVCTWKQVSMHTQSDWKQLQAIIENSTVNSFFMMQDNSQLDMFYLSQFMQENVYYVPEADAYVVAEFDEASVVIMDVFSKDKVDIDVIINTLGVDVKTVTLLFVPCNLDGFETELVQEEDTTLFVKGDILEQLPKKFVFPPLCHA